MNKNIFKEWAKAGKAKKEEKQIDELSTDTLKSYRKKASSDAVDRLVTTDPKSRLKYGKRLTGMGRSYKKLVRRGEYKEEKQLDELDQATIGSYMKKAHNQIGDLNKKAYKKDPDHGDPKNLSKPDQKKLKKRAAGTDRAWTNYVARHTGINHDTGKGFGRMRNSRGMGRDHKAQNPTGSLAKKNESIRTEAYKQDGEIAGIISELKARTIGSYIRKATDNLARQKSGYETTKKHNERSQEMKGKVSKGMWSMQNVYKNQIKKREKGLDKADKALAKKEGYEFSEEELKILEAKLAQLEEALKGDQHKLDVDKDGEIEASDLKKLRSKKKKKDDEEEVVMNPKKGDDEATNENVKSADRKPEKYKDEKGRERVRMVAVDRDMIKKESVDMSIRDKLMSVFEKKKHGDEDEKQAHDDNWSPSAKKMADDHKGETEDLADKASKSVEDANKKTAGSSQHNRPADNKQGDKSIVNQVADALKGLSKK